jgi:hypothetical protein
MPDNIWMLSTDGGAEKFLSQDEMLEFCADLQYTDEIQWAISSCLNRKTGVRTMITHNAIDILDWLDGYLADREREAMHVRRDRMGAPA